MMTPADWEQAQTKDFSYFGDESSGSVSKGEMQIKTNTRSKNPVIIPETEK
jgi:hypothetical protein